jgi:hypothetical protein
MIGKSGINENNQSYLGNPVDQAIISICALVRANETLETRILGDPELAKSMQDEMVGKHRFKNIAGQCNRNRRDQIESSLYD